MVKVHKLRIYNSENNKSELMLIRLKIDSLQDIMDPPLANIKMTWSWRGQIN